MDTRRTTVNLPQDLLEAAKTVAFNRKTTLTNLIQEGLSCVLFGDKKGEKKKNLRGFIGGLNLGIKKFRREEVYDEYLRKKVSP